MCHSDEKSQNAHRRQLNPLFNFIQLSFYKIRQTLEKVHSIEFFHELLDGESWIFCRAFVIRSYNFLLGLVSYFWRQPGILLDFQGRIHLHIVDQGFIRIILR